MTGTLATQSYSDLNKADVRQVVKVQQWREKRYDVCHPQIYVARYTQGTVRQRLADIYFATWMRPMGGGGIYPQRQRLADAMDWSLDETTDVLRQPLACFRVTRTEVAEFRVSMKAEAFEAMLTWRETEGKRLDIEWDTHNAPVRYEARYHPEQEQDEFADTVHLASIMLASTQRVRGRDERRENVAYPASYLTIDVDWFANRVGIEAEQAERLVDRLVARGWRAEPAEGGGWNIAPGDGLLSAWNLYNEAVFAGDGAKGRETGYENVWREKRGLDPIDWNAGRAVRPSAELDTVPPAGSWHIYHLASPDGEWHYVGITRGSLRERLRGHLDRNQHGKRIDAGAEHNPGVQALCQDLAREGREPTISLLATVQARSERHAEQDEHEWVRKAVERFGADRLLNIVHHPDPTINAGKHGGSLCRHP